MRSLALRRFFKRDPFATDLCHDLITLLELPAKDLFGQYIFNKALDRPFKRTCPEHRIIPLIDQELQNLF
jgi:hypothetical protein